MGHLFRKASALLTNIHLSSLISNLTFSATAFLSFLLLSRNLPPSVFGGWVLFLSVASLVDMVISGLTRSAVVYFGCGDDEGVRHRYNAASLLIMLGVVALVSVSFFGIVALFGEALNKDWRAILIAYPFIGISGVLRMSALSFLHARGQYHKTIFFRLIQSVGFLMIVFVLILFFKTAISFWSLAIAYFATSLASSIYVFFKGWSSAHYLFSVKRSEVVTILQYGKYTLFTNLGSSLLKSSDSFLIGLSAFGTAGVAIYAIPFKLVELIEIPLRSLAMSFFNEVSRLAKETDWLRIRHLFVRYWLLLSFFFVPITGFFLLFPRFILEILGKGQYEADYPIMIAMLYIIAGYSFLMIPDRLIGVILEGIGKPRRNTFKTLLMALCNIVGNLIALFIFHSLLGVAYATVVFTLIGVAVGVYLLQQARLLPSKAIFREECLFLWQNKWRWLRR